MKRYKLKFLHWSETGAGAVVSYQGSPPFTLVARYIVFLREPRPGMELETMVPDWLALKHWHLVGLDMFLANKRRIQARAAALKAGEDIARWDRRYRPSWGRYDLLSHIRETWLPLVTDADRARSHQWLREQGESNPSYVAGGLSEYNFHRSRGNDRRQVEKVSDR